ncbi:MAG TPA: HlyD family secretion protein [Rickettsia endosymbiont of Sericostoma sp.]|uniref:HlyD family secretion protein n=2 Tax=Candidatus Tisiphia TaxID=2996317 RepID=UPI001DC06EEA|nr:HlyD family secretion protein [Rickettsia endosymbiont of Sericostoma sp.]
MLEAFEKYKSHPFFKYFLVLFSVIVVYLAYNIYIWSHTESTDNAYIEADISSVSSEISGVIKNVLISDNMRVKKGDLIAEIDDQDYKSRLASLESSINASIKNIEIIEQKTLITQFNLQQSKEAVDFANTNLEINSTEYTRVQELNKGNFSSKKTLDESRMSFTKAKTDYNQAKLNLQIAQQKLLLLALQKTAEEEKLKGLLQDKNIIARSVVNTKITAPVNGIIANSSLQVGNFISPGRVLFFVVQDERIYVKANFKETQIAKFQSGQKVKLQFDSLPKKVIYGIIRNVSPATGSKFSLIPSDNATGNFTKIVQRVPVLIDFEVPKNGTSNLMPGMSVIVSVRTDET